MAMAAIDRNPFIDDKFISGNRTPEWTFAVAFGLGEEVYVKRDVEKYVSGFTLDIPLYKVMVITITEHGNMFTLSDRGPKNEDDIISKKELLEYTQFVAKRSIKMVAKDILGFEI